MRDGACTTGNLQKRTTFLLLIYNSHDSAGATGTKQLPRIGLMAAVANPGKEARFAAVRKELERIPASQMFRNAEAQKKFL